MRSSFIPLGKGGNTLPNFCMWLYMKYKLAIL